MTQNTQHCVYDAVQNQLIALVRLKSRREKRRAQGGHYPIPGPAENLRIGWICQPLLLVGILTLFQSEGGWGGLPQSLQEEGLGWYNSYHEWRSHKW